VDVLGFAVLVVVGFTACAEFGSYAFVHPVIRRLPAEHHLAVEKGLLRTWRPDAGIRITLRRTGSRSATGGSSFRACVRGYC
jgi:hypothetical protein